MAQYNLPDTVDKDKIFIVRRSELEGRFDASFYRENLDFSNCTKLSKIADVKGGKRIPLGYDYADSETSNLYFRVVNFDENRYVNYSNLKYISDKLYNILNRYELFENELIISIAGTIGKIQIVRKIPTDKKIILTENCAKIKVKDSAVLSEYFALILQTSFLQRQIKLSYIQTTIPKLGLDKILDLRIPFIPSIERQQQIVNFHRQAFTQKQQKEAEAKQLLDSIDGYLLGELGITLPEKDNSLPSRIFTTQFKDITGGRFDAPSTHSDFDLNSTKYNNIPFVKYIRMNPQWGEIDKDSLINFIPMDAIDEVFGTIAYKEDRLAAESRGYTLFIEDDILWAKITPCMQNGKSTIAKNLLNGLGFGSTEYYVFRVDNTKINREYVFAILRLKVLREAAMLYFGGAAGHQRVSSVFFKELLIPLPPLEKQNEIAKHIQGIRNRAKQLQEEATAILEKAKQEVEQMILG